MENNVSLVDDFTVDMVKKYSFGIVRLLLEYQDGATTA